jgi:uncharacterized protein YajQ (UPF0234 family)
MSTTPITDANEYKVSDEGNGGMGDDYAERVVPVEIARQLENSLVKMTHERDELLKSAQDTLARTVIDKILAERSLDEIQRLLRQVTSDIKWIMGTRAGVSAFNLAEIRNDIEQADKYLANPVTNAT